MERIQGGGLFESLRTRNVSFSQAFGERSIQRREHLSKLKKFVVPRGVDLPELGYTLPWDSHHQSPNHHPVNVQLERSLVTRVYHKAKVCMLSIISVSEYMLLDDAILMNNPVKSRQ